MEASKAFDAPVERIILIFSGKILKDDDSVEQHKIKNGLTVHIVISVSNLLYNLFRKLRTRFVFF